MPPLLGTRNGEGNRLSDQSALNELLPAVYAELRRQAERCMRGQSPGHSLQATALVHEAYLRLVGRDAHARARRAAKRGGGAFHLSLGAAESAGGLDTDFDVEALDEALARCAAFDPEKSRVVELRYFGGLNIEEVAEVLGTSAATVKRQWSTARTWLRRELAAGHP